MKENGRYDVSNSIEAQCEPGSHDTVLKNKLGITDAIEMDKLEAEALIKAINLLLQQYDEKASF